MVRFSTILEKLFFLLDQVVPEFIQEMAQPELVAAEAFNFLESKTDMYKTDMFKAISSRTGAPKQVAVSIFQFLD